MTSGAYAKLDTDARIAIIGSGFSGLAAAIALKKKGINNFVIFEQEAGLGGTWWNNRYPGAEVDLESHIYSFSFERYDWTRTHASWAELLTYLNHVARKWGLISHLRFNEKVEAVTWSDERKEYAIATSSKADHGAFRAVISAVGFLNIPLLPPFARRESDFKGVQCHTSRWPKGLSMAGKRVGILGTGSSAVQVIHEAALEAASVKIFQKEANWILPKDSRDFTASERFMHKFAPIYWWKRFWLYYGYDTRQFRASHARKDGRVNKRRAAASLAYLQNSLADRPDLLKLATPDFPFEARRTVISDTYYDDLKNPKVELVPYGAAKLSAAGIIDEGGHEHPLDIIIYATGFDAANYLAGMKVAGEHGIDLHEKWAGEPEALLGLMVPGFPNFFMMYGPNTNAIPLVTFYQAQANFCASLISTMLKTRRRTIKVDAAAFRRFNQKIQAALAKTVWGSTTSYFQASTGKIVAQWPHSATEYILATKAARKNAVKIE
ncbi:flavin-containing monooxygenase [Mesorhizobium sp. CO1-1-8]|uniref:flavin-containing monooxygenase n=1 Tax=Mesorhizobium sp. CO1-1-8 TaxID=2876631 RepID=UPI001CD0EBC0|nr:NAD(P)/FAD-dependent oxidoreductase [Mesorhizobium sp. CO1-1-8]MBZ9772445.1 NAD(P)/FAD-dependent oxidoreductase [Mesorhizobium sp. CO1-1-8]MBZ9772457.1 NAD(P)/FAD-dependent oxidoreductase [Mesorhizobium sp. CO1-1-8]